jgi:hypothetical protein
MTICSQTSHCILSSIGCFIYDFQTLLTGVVAIGVAVIAGIPVWRQLKDSNLQTRISHRETLATLLRDALQRYGKIEKSITEPLSLASRLTSDPMGEPVEIAAEDAHHIESALNGVLDWYLVLLKDTEHGDIEMRKTELKAAPTEAIATLGEAHWADHNDQHDPLGLHRRQPFLSPRHAGVEPVDPKPAVGIEHHFGDFCFFEPCRDRWTERALQHRSAACVNDGRRLGHLGLSPLVRTAPSRRRRQVKNANSGRLQQHFKVVVAPAAHGYIGVRWRWRLGQSGCG